MRKEVKTRNRVAERRGIGMSIEKKHEIHRGASDSVRLVKVSYTWERDSYGGNHIFGDGDRVSESRIICISAPWCSPLNFIDTSYLRSVLVSPGSSNRCRETSKKLVKVGTDVETGSEGHGEEEKKMASSKLCR